MTIPDGADPFPDELGNRQYTRDRSWEGPSNYGVHLVARYTIQASSSYGHHAAVKYYAPDQRDRGDAERRALRELARSHNVGVVPKLAEYEQPDGGLFIVTQWIQGGPLAARTDLPLSSSWIDRAVPRWLENIQQMIESINIVTNDQAAENCYPTDYDLLIGDLDHAVPANTPDPPATRPWYAPPGSCMASEKEVYGAGLVLFEIVTGHRILELAGADAFGPRVHHVVRSRVEDLLGEIGDDRHRLAITALLGAPGRGALPALEQAIDLLRKEPGSGPWRRRLIGVAVLGAFAAGTAGALVIAGGGSGGDDATTALKTPTKPSTAPVTSVPASSPAPETTSAPTTSTVAPTVEPTADFQVATNAAEIHEPYRFEYQALDLGEGQTMALQQEVGTAGGWSKVSDLDPAGTSGEMTPEHVGTSRYRTAVLAEDGTTELATSTARTVHVFGPVPLSRITDEASDTVRIGSTLLRFYAYEVSDHRFKLEDSTCRAVNLRVGFLQGDSTGTPSVTVTVVSETASPIRVEIPHNTIRHVRGRVGGDFEVYAANGEIGGFADDRIFLNGTLDCSTYNGREETTDTVG